ncbi:centlein isoform X1 [Pantherophis guttatus]|uniref:Centlein isoform X1 n=1 Tax=Pantherophis guttatus TaxID=94885 RepID=A0A6P9B607_PANGU|nr:centlein isoform X1 [Pantherophis guttatus]
MASSKRKDPASAAASRIFVLEEEVRSLTEELNQCQADKEFVWSLWKRLQVANPDVTQAISLVVEREKQKAELKDRKVLEILQVKDNKIQTLEQRTSGQQEEINNLVQRKIAVDEENVALKNELCILQKSQDVMQEIKDTKECAQRKDEQSRLVIKNLEKENEGLSTRYADLLNDLEKLKKQDSQWRIEKSGIDAKIKNLESALREARGQVEVLHNRCDDLASQLGVKQAELTQKDLDVARAKKELQELQNLYKQNTEHAAQQAELIQQLQTLNTDTQKVLRTQEDAHTAETISYQKLYNELTICFEKLKASEVQLRQNQVPLQDKLFEKEQHINQLEKQLHEAFCSASSFPYQTYPEPRKGEFQQYSLTELKYLVMSQKTEIELLQKKLKRTNRSLANHSLCSRDFLDCISTRAEKKYKKPPVKRSRSLSPKSFLKESEELRKLKIAERKIENLEKTLQLKIQENDELRQAHEKRKKRLQTLQINYRAVKNQLKQLEEGYGKPGNNKNGKERSDPQHLRQENSDAVWNELAYFKKEHKKLLIEKLNLEEELDQMKVHASRDKTTIQELNMCLQQEREELLYKLGEEDEVNHSTPKKNVKEISAQTLQKISQLERRIMGFEKESKKLKEINKGLVKDKSELKLLLKQHAGDAEDREKELKILVEKITEAKKDKSKLQLIIDGLEKEVTSLKRQVAEGNVLKNENVDLLIQVKQLQSLLDKAKMVDSKATVEAACGQCRCKNTGANVKLKTGKKKSLVEHQSLCNQSIKDMSGALENFSKDGWEDMSESSDTEILSSENLETRAVHHISLTKRNEQQEQNKIENNKIIPNSMCLEDESKLRQKKKNKGELVTTVQRKKILNSAFNPYKVNREKIRSIMVQKPGSSVSLWGRITSLQQQLAVVQKSKRTAVSSLKKSREANKRLTSQLHLTKQQLQASKQTVQQTLTSSLTELQREKSGLQGKLDHLIQATKGREGLSLLASGHTGMAPATPVKTVDLEMKQLQCKLKNANNEITKHSSTIKSLKSEVQRKEEQMQELQEKISRMERDISMKRHLIEDWRLRMKTYQEKEKSFNETLQCLEEKAKTLTEDCSNKKISIDSLKQRLNVATKEKTQYEQMYHRTKEDLEKKELNLSNLEAKMAETEYTMTELETTASQQLHSLARQSEQALEMVQKKLIMSNEKVEEFITFVKSLATELQHNVKEMRTRIRCTKKMQEDKKCGGNISKESVHRAQTLAASILNISKTDLDEILDVVNDEETEQMKMEYQSDKEWLSYLQKLLEGQFPFASYLMDAVLEKLNEQKKLAEEYSSLMKRAA